VLLPRGIQREENVYYNNTYVVHGHVRMRGGVSNCTCISAGSLWRAKLILSRPAAWWNLESHFGGKGYCMLILYVLLLYAYRDSITYDTPRRPMNFHWFQHIFTQLLFVVCRVIRKYKTVVACSQRIRFRLLRGR